MLTKQEELKQKQTKNFLFSFNILHYKVVVWTDLVLLLICNEISQEVIIGLRLGWLKISNIYVNTGKKNDYITLSILHMFCLDDVQRRTIQL